MVVMVRIYEICYLKTFNANANFVGMLMLMLMLSAVPVSANVWDTLQTLLDTVILHPIIFILIVVPKWVGYHENLLNACVVNGDYEFEVCLTRQHGFLRSFHY